MPSFVDYFKYNKNRYNLVITIVYLLTAFPSLYAFKKKRKKANVYVRMKLTYIYVSSSDKHCLYLAVNHYACLDTLCLLLLTLQYYFRYDTVSTINKSNQKVFE